MQTLKEKIRYDDLRYYFKTESSPMSFNDFHHQFGFKRTIEDGFMDLKRANENQEKTK